MISCACIHQLETWVNYTFCDSPQCNKTHTTDPHSCPHFNPQTAINNDPKPATMKQCLLQ